MSANTKIVVLRRKELLYTGIFAALGVLFIILLLMLLLPGKDTDASYGTPDSPDDTAATEMPDNVADVSTGAVADTGNTYIPGIYTTELILGSETVNVEVIVNDHAITSLSLADPDETLTTKADEARAKFCKAMDDDLNTPDALAAVFDLVKEINTLSAASSKAALEAAAKAFDEITGVLGLMYNRKKDEVPAEVTELVEKRAAAKKAKDWAAADAIRAQLTEMGWAVKDTAQGPQLSKI